MLRQTTDALVVEREVIEPGYEPRQGALIVVPAPAHPHLVKGARQVRPVVVALALAEQDRLAAVEVEGIALITEERRSGTISTDSDLANVSDRASKCAIVRAVVTESSEECELSDVVETALAKALLLAAQGECWDVVGRIADELESRRGERLARHSPARAAGNR